MVVIDAHNHVPNSYLLRSSYLQPATGKPFDADSVIEGMERVGIDMLVLIPHPDHVTSVLEVARHENDQVAEIVRSYPNRFVGYCVSTPYTGGDRGVGELERAARRLGLRGLKLHPRTMGHQTLDQLGPLLGKASELRIPVTIHSTAVSAHPDRVGFFARQFPELQFILAHFGGEEGWRFAIEEARFNENVTIETSAFTNNVSAIRKAVREAGAHKIVFGLDATGVDEAPYVLHQMRSLNLPRDQFDAIMGGNMARLLGLSP